MADPARINRYSIKARGSFAAMSLASGDTFIHVPVLGTPTIKKDQMVDDAQEADNDGSSSADYPTARGASFSFETRVHTGTKALDGASGDTAPTSCYAQELLESYFGHDAVTFAGTTVAASSGPGATTPLKLTSASGLTVGQMLQVGSEHRFVVAISGADATLDADLATASNYDAGTAVYGAFNFEPTMGDYANVLDLNHERSSSLAEAAGPGQVNDFKIAGLSSKQGLRYQFGMVFDDWDPEGVIPTSFTYNTFTGTPLVALGGTIAIAGTSTACADAAVSFGVKKEETSVNSTAGAPNGRSGWCNTEGPEPTIELTPYYSGDNLDRFRARTAVPIRLVFTTGSSNIAKARGSLGVFMPQGQVFVEDAVVNGQRAHKLRIVGRRPTPAQKAAGLDKPILFAVGGGV